MDTKKKNKNKGKLKRLIPTMGFMLLGGICGMLMVLYGGLFDYESSEISLSSFAVMFVAMYIAMYIQIAVHEAGHLIFGLASGYEFCSYRLGKLMWVKQNGKLSFKRYSLSGTGGQCLMSPPEIKEGKMPVILYNLGGSIMNLFTSALCTVLYFVFRDTDIISTVFTFKYNIIFSHNIQQ